MKKPALDLLSAYRANQDASVSVGYLLVTLMMVTISIGFAQIGRRLVADWNGTYLVIMTVFVAIEALLARKRARDLEGREKIIFRLSEWVAFAVAIKLLLYIVNGFDRLLTDLPLWQENFLEHFFTGEYVIALILAFIVWLSTGAFANELEDLYDRESDASWDELGKLQNSLRAIRTRITTRVFMLGTLVVALAVLTRVDATAILRSTGQFTPGYMAPVVNVLAYFLLALVLLSQTQFALLRTRWLWQRLPISTEIAKNWVRFGLLFFALLAVIVFFLPTEYSLGLFDTLRIFVDFLVQLSSLLMFLILLPLTLCMSLFSLAGSGAPPQQAQPFEVPPQVPGGQPVAWLEFVRSLAFWLIFLGIIIFAVRYYLGQNTALWKAIRAFPLVRWLANAWGSLTSWLRGANRQITGLVREGIQRLRPRRVTGPAGMVRRLINLSRMSPREKIIHFYVNLLELGGERGLERRPHQTPYQYEASVASAVPEIDQDLRGLTDTFLEARYSRHPVEEPQASHANSLWERIKAILRSWRRADH